MIMFVGRGGDNLHKPSPPFTTLALIKLEKFWKAIIELHIWDILLGRIPSFLGYPLITAFSSNYLKILVLKGLSQGHNAIFKGLKMTFRMKILKKKLYHVNQRQKYYKCCFDNFFLRRFFLPCS